MAFRIVLIIFSSLSLVRCAQVGYLNGGEKDDFAPRAVETNPANESVLFTGNQISIEFDEFVQLNNPQQNIFIVPADATIKSKLTKKTLELSWEETLKENTTYVVYLNGAVKDVSEGNDSLMRFVFSTGSFIDSLNFETRVVDAWTGEALRNCLVGLFINKEDPKPLYFASTSQFGLARFSNLKTGNYYVKAYKDEDKNLEINENEGRAFRSEAIQLDSSIVDTVPLRFYTPYSEKIKSFNYRAPGCFSLVSNYSLDNASFTLNDIRVDTSYIKFITTDSLLLFTKIDTLNSFRLDIKGGTKIDSAFTRITNQEKKLLPKIVAVHKAKALSPNAPMTFEINDLISAVNKDKILITDLKDSSVVPLNKVTFDKNILTLDCDRTDRKNIRIDFGKSCLETLNSSGSDSASVYIELGQERDSGIINLSLFPDSSTVIVHLLKNNLIVSSVNLAYSLAHQFTYLEPGEYSFRLIKDSNANGKWDVGNELESLQPEDVIYFTNPIKVRANWEIDVTLESDNK